MRENSKNLTETFFQFRVTITDQLLESSQNCVCVYLCETHIKI